MSIQISVDLGDTLAKLDSILKNVEDGITAVEFDTDDMVNSIVVYAKEVCPVDTGRLQESIRAEGSFPSYMIIADATNDQGVQYGKFVEFGTSLQVAQPFLWPVVYEALAEYIPKIRADFRRAIAGA